MSVASQLAQWAIDYAPHEDDGKLAQLAVQDALACALAARDEELLRAASMLPEAALWGVAAHALDLDDVHIESTTHISAVCVPATVALGGSARDYLVGAGVMARIGMLLGWGHYTAGWHATATTGAFGSAAAAASVLGLDQERFATALALAVPAAGGSREAFGSDAKPLQIGFAVQAGVRAALLSRNGVSANTSALDSWLKLVQAAPDGELDLHTNAAIPGGLAFKLFPCCYALQRPIQAVSTLRGEFSVADISKIRVETTEASSVPLLYSSPVNGMQGKFSLEYGVAAALLDEYCGTETFSTAGVQRPEAQRLSELVEVDLVPGAPGLLGGSFVVEITAGSQIHRSELAMPSGAPGTEVNLTEKILDSVTGTGLTPGKLTFATGAGILRRFISNAVVR